jgi:hypothetical protein
VIISTHAVKQYQERIENVGTAEVCRRIRERKGPPFQRVMRGDTVITIYPVNDTTTTQAVKKGVWTSWN